MGSPSSRLTFFAVIGFIAASLITVQVDSGGNALARFMTLQSMAMRHSYDIDPYYTRTNDWSQGENGHFYSNKAPGPAFLAFPLFAPLTYLFGSDANGLPKFPTQLLICILFQILPFAWMGTQLAKRLAAQGVSDQGILVFYLSFFFGNTASILMSFFVGHGVSAILLLAVFFSITGRRPLLTGFFLGFSLLSDYGTAVLIPALVLLMALDPFWRDIRNLGKFLLGGILPGALWVHYHLLSFGGVLRVPHGEVSPTIERTNGGSGIFSAIRIYPGFWITHQLMWGSNRGLLWTQPWLVVVWGVAIQDVWKSFRACSQNLFFKLALFCPIGLGSLYYMNACFKGWHGGSMPGPRYMSMIFPLFACLAAYYWDRRGPGFKKVLSATLGMSLLFRALVGSGNFMPPAAGSIWMWFLDGLFTYRNGSEWWKFFVVLTCIALPLVFTKFVWKTTRVPSYSAES